jgi:hypothetical protein
MPRRCKTGRICRSAPMKLASDIPIAGIQMKKGIFIPRPATTRAARMPSPAPLGISFSCELLAVGTSMVPILSLYRITSHAPPSPIRKLKKTRAMDQARPMNRR